MPRLSRFGLTAALAIAPLIALTAPVRAAEPDKLLPADADTVAFVNVKQLAGSDVVKKYALEQIKQTLDGQEVKKILEEMGLNPLTDIEKVWIGMSGKDQADLKVLTIIHGTFDPDKLLKAAEAATKKDADKFSMIKDGNVTLFKYQPDQGNPVYGTVVNNTTVIAATDKKLVTDALKQADDQKKAPIKAELTDLIKTMDEKVSAFGVSLVKGKLDNLKIPPQLSETLNLGEFEKALPKTNTLTLALRVTEDVNLEIVFGMKDDDSAADMDAGLVKAIDNIKALVPLIAAAEPKAKPLTEVVKTIKNSAKKKNVTMSLKITGENLGKMINPEN